MDILQALQNQYTANANITAVISLGSQAGSMDVTPPVSEGTQVLSQSITLANAANKVLVKVTLWGQMDPDIFPGVDMAAILFRGSTCLDGRMQAAHSDDFGQALAMTVLDASGSTGPHTYSVRVGFLATTEDAGDLGAALRLNGAWDGRRFGGVSKCTLTLLEIG